MSISAAELEKMFDAAVPLLFQRQWLQLIRQCYTEADSARNAHGLLKPVADWHLPFLRRALIESQTAELAKRFPSLQVEMRRTKVSAVPYLAITAGPFVITESKVDEPGQLPRDADFRTENSAVNYSLFAEENNTTDPLYFILATVPHPSECRPRYARFIFPDSEYSRIYHDIDLLGRFDAGADQATTPETPKVDPTPKLRKPDAEKGGAQA